ncbi:MAG: AAA family ATPase [Candidatus Hodarchaeales archaeon]
MKLRDYFKNDPVLLGQLEEIFRKKGVGLVNQSYVEPKSHRVNGVRREHISTVIPERHIAQGYHPLPLKDIFSNPPESPDWLVEPLFPLNGISVIGGDGNVGKSWLTLHLALCVASDKPFLNKFTVQQGDVLIIDEENPLSLIYERTNQLSRSMQVNPNELPIHILGNNNFKLDNDSSINSIRLWLGNVKPKLIIIDSLIRVHSADENSSVDMNKVMQSAKALSTEFGLTILITHHTRKSTQNNNTSQLLRGTSDIRNFVDSHLYMSGNGEVKTFVHDKARFAEKVSNFKAILHDEVEKTATSFIYQGEIKPKERVDKQGKAKEIILGLLGEHRMLSRKQIIESAKNQVGETNIDKALRALIEEECIRVETANRNQRVYSIYKE